MTIHTVVPGIDHRSLWLRLGAVVVVIVGVVVFGWSLRLPLFIAFAIGAGVLGAVDWRNSSTTRLVAGWSIAAAILLVVIVQLADSGVAGLVPPVAFGAAAVAVLSALHRLYPAGLDVDDVAASAFAAFVLGSFGWVVPLAAFVIAAVIGGLVGGYRILRTGIRDDVAVPFPAILGLTAVVAALVAA